MALMEVIESVNNSESEMIERFPADGGGEIKWGAQLTVRDSQWAVLYRDGKALEAFDAGRHVLTTQNIPVLTKFVTQFGYGEDSPFRADVVFVSKRLFPNIKWGTTEPIVFRDPELKMIRLRSYGTQSIRVKDPLIFLNNLVGTQGYYTTRKISDYLRHIVTSKLAEVIASVGKSIFDLPAQYGLISSMVKTESVDIYDNLGLELVDYIINAINPPKQVQEIMDKKTSMAVISDMKKYMQYQTATAIGDAASNPDGKASDGVGLGAGLGLGMILPSSIMQSFNQSMDQPAQTAGVSGSENPIANKLVSLKSLLEQELITKEEFDLKRDQIIKEL